MEEKIITCDNLTALVNELITENYVVIGETGNGIGWNKIENAGELKINHNGIPSNISYKEFLFAKTEPVFFFRSNKDNYDLIEADPEKQNIVLIGAKPCDAASIGIMNKVFNWDYKDKFFNDRADKAVVIGVLCNYRDEFCFCTSVGINPGSSKGSDLFLIPLDDENFAVRIVAEKGKNFIGPFEKYFTEGNQEFSNEVLSKMKEPTKKFESTEIRKWLTNNFEHRIFDEAGEICLSCGQCAFVCPVCHCLHIVDEECDYTCGRRMKNWDACQFGLFTLHGSGHNPRETQGNRYRQRVAHKFKYYVDKFDEILCSGCGRCSRGCPVGIDISLILSETKYL